MRADCPQLAHLAGCDDYNCKAIGSSHRARRGAGCWLRTTLGAFGGTPISSSPIAWEAASAARRPVTGRACPDGRPGGGGVGSDTFRTIKRRSTRGCRFCGRFACGCGRRHAPGRCARVSSEAAAVRREMRAPAPVRMRESGSRLRPGDRHTSPNQAYGTPLIRLPPKSLLSGLGAPLGFPLAERGARSKDRTIRPGDAPRSGGL